MGGASLAHDLNLSRPNRLCAASLVQLVNRTRWVEIEFIPKGQSQATNPTCYVKVESLPVAEVLFSLLWFVLQTIAFAIGAAVYWNRPFRPSVAAFYLLCLVTLGAFLGSNHWWIVAGSFWLTAPSMICAMLLAGRLPAFFSCLSPHVAAAGVEAAHVAGPDLRTADRRRTAPC